VTAGGLNVEVVLPDVRILVGRGDEVVTAGASVVGAGEVVSGGGGGRAVGVEADDGTAVGVVVGGRMTVGVVAGGGTTLRVNLAPHAERGVPLGQHPASVQYDPAGQYLPLEQQVSPALGL